MTQALPPTTAGDPADSRHGVANPPEAHDVDRYRFIRERCLPEQLRELAALIESAGIRPAPEQIDGWIDTLIATDLATRFARRNCNA